MGSQQVPVITGPSALSLDQGPPPPPSPSSRPGMGKGGRAGVRVGLEEGAPVTQPEKKRWGGVRTRTGT